MAVTFHKKSENLNIRIDAQTRYGLDLLGRLKRRSVSELVLEDVRNRIAAELPRQDVDGRQIPLLEAVWDVFEQDRLVKLALVAPDLLTEDEQKIWRVISEDRAYLAKGGKPNFGAIRADWKAIHERVHVYERSAKE